MTEHLALEEVRPSIGSVGDAYDNALMECINGLYKAECIRTTVFHNGPYNTIADIEYATAGWVDWYNNRRLHSTLGNVPPLHTSKPTTLLSTESRTPHRNGKEPGALHTETHRQRMVYTGFHSVDDSEGSVLVRNAGGATGSRS